MTGGAAVPLQVDADARTLTFRHDCSTTEIVPFDDIVAARFDTHTDIGVLRCTGHAVVVRVAAATAGVQTWREWRSFMWFVLLMVIFCPTFLVVFDVLTLGAIIAACGLFWEDYVMFKPWFGRQTYDEKAKIVHYLSYCCFLSIPLNLWQFGVLDVVCKDSHKAMVVCAALIGIIAVFRNVLVTHCGFHPKFFTGVVFKPTFFTASDASTDDLTGVEHKQNVFPKSLGPINVEYKEDQIVQMLEVRHQLLEALDFRQPPPALPAHIQLGGRNTVVDSLLHICNSAAWFCQPEGIMWAQRMVRWILIPKFALHPMRNVSIGSAWMEQCLSAVLPVILMLCCVLLLTCVHAAATSVLQSCRTHMLLLRALSVAACDCRNSGLCEPATHQIRPFSLCIQVMFGHHFHHALRIVAQHLRRNWAVQIVEFVVYVLTKISSLWFTLLPVPSVVSSVVYYATLPPMYVATVWYAGLRAFYTYVAPVLLPVDSFMIYLRAKIEPLRVTLGPVVVTLFQIASQVVMVVFPKIWAVVFGLSKTFGVAKALEVTLAKLSYNPAVKKAVANVEQISAELLTPKGTRRKPDQSIMEETEKAASPKEKQTTEVPYQAQPIVEQSEKAASPKEKQAAAASLLQEAVPPQMIDGKQWVRHIDKKRQKAYYYNKEDKKPQWEPPVGWSNPEGKSKSMRVNHTMACATEERAASPSTWRQRKLHSHSRLANQAQQDGSNAPG